MGVVGPVRGLTHRGGGGGGRGHLVTSKTTAVDFLPGLGLGSSMTLSHHGNMDAAFLSPVSAASKHGDFNATSSGQGVGAMLIFSGVLACGAGVGGRNVSIVTNSSCAGSSCAGD